MFELLAIFGLYFLGGLITYYGVYIYRVLEYKKSGITHINCEQYIKYNCEDEYDIIMYIFWPVTIILSFIVFISNLMSKIIGKGIKTLIKKLLKVE